MKKINKKLQGWKAKLLSQASRSVLCKSILQSLPMFHMSPIKFSKGQIKSIGACFRNFWWKHNTSKKRMKMLSWDFIQRPVFAGGLGFLRLNLFNLATLAK